MNPPEDLPYEVLDVFTDVPYSGNPLAVVRLSTDLPQTLKQKLAKEFNLSETIFLHDASENGTKVDIFTPDAELPFAGHPTIGAAFCVFRDGAGKKPLLLKAGKVEIEQRDEYTFAKIPHNIHGHAIKCEGAVVWSIVPGMTFILVHLNSEEDLKAQKSERKLDIKDLDDGWQKGLIGTYYYTESDAGADVYNTRMFTSFDGSIIEDAATGSAACTLAAFLSHCSQKTLQAFQFIQGIDMGRPSKIRVKIMRKDNRLHEAELGGQAVQVMKGRMKCPRVDDERVEHNIV